MSFTPRRKNPCLQVDFPSHIWYWCNNCINCSEDEKHPQLDSQTTEDVQHQSIKLQMKCWTKCRHIFHPFPVCKHTTIEKILPEGILTMRIFERMYNPTRKNAYKKMSLLKCTYTEEYLTVNLNWHFTGSPQIPVYNVTIISMACEMKTYVVNI